MDNKFYEYITVSQRDCLELFTDNTAGDFRVRIPEIKLNKKKYNYYLGLVSVQYQQRLLKKGEKEPSTLSVFCDITGEDIVFSKPDRLLRRFASFMS